MDSLNATALANGMMFGAAAATQVLTDPQYAALYQQHCGIITTDIALKWSTVRPTADFVPNWGPADQLIAWAETNGIMVKGHNLAWNEYNPAWLWSSNSTGPDYGVLNVAVQDAQRYFDQHVTETVGRYAGRIPVWDVVNEPIEPAHGRADLMRSKTWMKVFGPDYVERAFRRAHAADSDAKLFMNEQVLDRMGCEKNRIAFLALVDRLLGRGVPIHGIGFESHLTLWAGVTHEGVMWLLEELRKRGLEVHISELDIAPLGGSNTALPVATTDTTLIDTRVAETTRSYLKDVLSFPNVKAVITWELADKYSWLIAQGQKRPLPFDDNYQPKSMAAEIERAFQNRRAG
ncbi:endo-1,4-beta-xylanase [Bradyrhizobium erythrophlei]|uniref:Beta-xylanase n=1 Tax=Bradyrhizobium erythrophlei TaxID=1437360 RepID=A0A1M5PUY7_9BRAD|nr:endo-1,4-beta-xylanase [Bradyrhizobium erythrophlei]SHH05655.1 endo-1,4-beta-xylanase [Bradyrhizobium erythrophlei]